MKSSVIWYVDTLNLKRQQKQSKLIRPPAADPPLLEVTNTGLWTHTHTEALNSAAVRPHSDWCDGQKIVLVHQLKSLDGNFKEHFDV